MTLPESRDGKDRFTLWSRPLTSKEMERLNPTMARMAFIVRALKWIATLTPLGLLAMLAIDGVSVTDMAVCAFVAAVLWLFVGIATVAASALMQLEQPGGTD